MKNPFKTKRNKNIKRKGMIKCVNLLTNILSIMCLITYVGAAEKRPYREAVSMEMKSLFQYFFV